MSFNLSIFVSNKEVESDNKTEDRCQSTHSGIAIIKIMRKTETTITKKISKVGGWMIDSKYEEIRSSYNWYCGY